MSRRVVFAGGIQARALAMAYRLDIAVDRDEDVFFIGTDALSREAAHRVIAAADTLITDVTEAGQTVAEHLIPAQAVRIGVPVVLADFLWPFAGRPHPLNQPTPSLPDGPYPASFGDQFLDTMHQEGVPEDEAIERYLALDIAAEADLDGVLRRRLAVQDQLDVQTGFDLTDFIAAQFRRDNLFAARDRMRPPLFKHVANALFRKMGARPDELDKLAEAHFPSGAMPIHPQVLRYFGMEVPAPDHRYPVLNEGMFSFEQFCRRYLQFAWNRGLHDAMLLAESNPEAAIPLLRDALEDSPGSIAGQRVLEEAERRVAERAQQDRTLSLPPPPTRRAASAHAPPPPAPPPHIDDHDDDWRNALASYVPLLPEPAPYPDQPAFGNLRFSPAQPDTATRPPSALTVFAPPSRPATLPLDEDEDQVSVPEPQPYVELPLYLNGREIDSPAAQEVQPARYTPLAPASDLIEVLPRLLSSTRGLSGLADEPFSKMPETMPPPPLRPVLPPELHSEPVKRGLIARILGKDG